MTSPPNEPYDAVDVIRTKRDGGRLDDGQVDWVVDAYTRGVVADEQMSALAMAILLNGMDRREIARWTDAMIRSGERMDFSGLNFQRYSRQGAHPREPFCDFFNAEQRHRHARITRVQVSAL